VYDPAPYLDVDEVYLRNNCDGWEAGITMVNGFIYSVIENINDICPPTTDDEVRLKMIPVDARARCSLDRKNKTLRLDRTKAKCLNPLGGMIIHHLVE
jgi:hypothetical protein